MKRFVVLLFLLSGCIQTENSSSQDADLYGGGAGGSADFLAARQVIRTNCSACHTFGTMTQAQLLAEGLFIPGDAVNSEIYYRLRNSTGPQGPKDMPDNGSTLSGTDLALIADWINNAL